MNSKSVLKEKSFHFSLQVIEICRCLRVSNTDYAMHRQLLRSGTAIGASIAESEFAQSKADFINKLSIALKEANETRYWMDLLCESQNIHKQSVADAEMLLTEIIKMLVSSIKTSKGKQ